MARRNKTIRIQDKAYNTYSEFFIISVTLEQRIHDSSKTNRMDNVISYCSRHALYRLLISTGRHILHENIKGSFHKEILALTHPIFEYDLKSQFFHSAPSILQLQFYYTLFPLESLNSYAFYIRKIYNIRNPYLQNIPFIKISHEHQTAQYKMGTDARTS